MRFSDRVCMVSGAGSGIGKACAMQFAREGGKVTVIDLNEQHGNQTVREIADAKGEAMFVKCDVGNGEQIQAAVKATTDKWQKVDVVVNDAAMMTFKPVVDLPDEEWDKVLNVNIRSVFLFCKYSARHMGPGGAIVNISSVHTHETTKNVVP
jgi:glucose 1-dehydrogenase